MKNEIKRAEQIECILELGEGIFRILLPTVPKEVLEIDLTMPQLKVVLLLFINGYMRMGTLASGLGVSMATTTGVVDRLVERDIVVREELPQDRRIVNCRLSDQGHALVNGIWTSARLKLKELLETASTSQLALIEKALASLVPIDEKVTVG